MFFKEFLVSSLRAWPHRLVPKGRRRKFCAAIAVLCAWFGLASMKVAHAQMALYKENRFEISVGLDATSVLFSQNNPWFGEAAANIGAETGEWGEFAVSPGLYFTIDSTFGGQVFGGISGVGTKTYDESADGIAVGSDDPGKITLEEAFLGWRRDFSEETSIELTGGNFDYEIGSGFLVKDGGSDGGNRGGFYLGARSAFYRSGLVRFTVGNLLTEAFYLVNNPRRGGIEGAIAGVNLEYDFSGRAKIGATYIDVVDVDDPQVGPVGEKLRTYDFRAEATPLENLTLSGEYAFQNGAGLFEGKGWWLQPSYSLDDAPLKPTLAYRYAVVTGDDPNTADSEEFKPLAYGFTDYAQWYQGEITGNWIFGNTNQRTHLVKGSISPIESITLTAVWLNIKLDKPGALGVASDNLGNEFDVFLDWQVNDLLFLSAAMAILSPGNGAKQFTGGADTWSHFMLYASFGL